MILSQRIARAYERLTQRKAISVVIDQRERIEADDNITIIKNQRACPLHLIYGQRVCDSKAVLENTPVLVNEGF
jgi:hypothetical protein